MIWTSISFLSFSNRSKKCWLFWLLGLHFRYTEFKWESADPFKINSFELFKRWMREYKSSIILSDVLSVRSLYTAASNEWWSIKSSDRTIRSFLITLECSWLGNSCPGAQSEKHFHRRLCVIFQTIFLDNPLEGLIFQLENYFSFIKNTWTKEIP